MPDLQSVSHEDFAACLNDKFECALDDEPAVQMTLAEVTARSGVEAVPDSRVPFTLLFTAEVDPPLAQGVYRIQHPSLDAMDIFLVPVARDGRATHYEAVFS